MSNIITQVFKSIVMALYQELGISIIITVLSMTAYLYVKEKGGANVARIMIENLHHSRDFLYTCLLILYITLIMLRTVFCRVIYIYPLDNVIGNWGLYDIDGKLYTENM